MGDIDVAEPNKPESKPAELTKLQFDYAWKWFSFHADQRVKMFNYMLLATGIFAASVGTVYKDHHTVVAIFLCSVGVILALIFSRLDRRNRDLVWLGEAVLIELEREAVFGREAKIFDLRLKLTQGIEKEVSYGILWRQLKEDAEHKPSVWSRAWQGRHRLLNPAIAYLIAVLFAILGIWIATHPY